MGLYGEKGSFLKWEGSTENRLGKEGVFGQSQERRKQF